MSAVEDFSRYVDTRRMCVCTHPRHWHILSAGLCIDGCTCVTFQGVDEKVTDSCLNPDHRADPYAGIYLNRKWEL